MTEINLTITSLSGQAESISLVDSSTSFSDLAEFATALLGISPESPISLMKDGQLLFSKNMGGYNSNKMLKEAGLKNGDLILVAPQANQNRATPQNNSTSSIAQSSPGMALDFSSLLNSSSLASPTPAPLSANAGLTFNIPGLYVAPPTQAAVEWEGMTLDDAIERNPNPDILVQILFNETKHPHLLKELNHHSPLLAKKLKDAGISVSNIYFSSSFVEVKINLTI